MPATHILLDTTCFLRLARSIRPLLGQQFGDQPYVLSVIPELNKELTSKRLQTEFSWIEAEELVVERGFFPQLSRANRKGIKTTFDFLWDHVATALPGPSRVDTTFVAYAIELNCLLVTDDQAMRQLASAFGARTWCTLELMRLMLDTGNISPHSIQALVAYWEYESDLPANFQSDFARLFDSP